MFSSVDCALLKLRNKEDPLNPIISGFATGAILAFRGGLLTALKNGLIGAGILALIEASGYLMYIIQLKRQQQMAEEMQRRQREDAKIKAPVRVKGGMTIREESGSEFK